MLHDLKMEPHIQKSDLRKKNGLGHFLYDFDIVIRTLIFITLLLIFCMEAWYEHNFPKNHWYYSFFIATSAAFFLILLKFDRYDFVSDMKDVAVIELAIQSLFLGLYFLPGEYYKFAGHPECKQLFKILNNMFMLLHSARLFWVAMNCKGGVCYTWPVIGFFGWCAKKSSPEREENAVWWNSLLVYLFVACSFALTKLVSKMVKLITHENTQVEEIAGFLLLLFVIVKFLIPAAFQIYQQNVAVHDALSEEQERNHSLAQANWRLRKDIWKSKRASNDCVVTTPRRDWLQCFDALNPAQQNVIIRQINTLVAKLFSSGK